VHAWRLLLAALLVVGLGAGLVYVVLTNGEVGDPVPTLASAVPSKANPVSGATVTLPVQPSSSTSASTTAVPSRIVTSTTATAPPVVVALRDALTAWGEFAVSGRMRDLGDHFVVGGPQRRRLRAEAESIRADPPGPPPYLVTTRDILTFSATPTEAVLRTEIEWARQGELTQFFVWDIQMQLVDGMWRLLTVEEVGETAER
jgi:hypothetical protein